MRGVDGSGHSVRVVFVGLICYFLIFSGIRTHSALRLLLNAARAYYAMMSVLALYVTQDLLAHR